MKLKLNFSKLGFNQSENDEVEKQIRNQTITPRIIEHDMYYTENHQDIIQSLDNAVADTSFSLSSVAINKLNEKLAMLNSLYKQSENITYNYSSITYKNNDANSVVRYGILIGDKLKNSITEFNKVLDNSAGSVFSLKSLNSAASSNRSNNSKKLSNKEKLTQKELLKTENEFMHIAELVVLKKALAELQNNSTVLIEFFERNGANQIVPNKDSGLYELHTVLLYKVPGSNDVVIIDPSNSEFSKHISMGINTALKEICIDDASSQAVNSSSSVATMPATSPLKICLPATNKLKIYVGEKGNIGPDFNQYRDCIDIAVKLAFAIQKNDNLDSADKNKSVLSKNNKGEYRISEWKPVIEISNQVELNKHLIYQEGFSAARMQQASENDDREKFMEFLKMFFDKFNGKESDFEPYIKEETMEKKFKNLLKTIVDVDSKGDYSTVLEKDLISSKLKSFKSDFKQDMDNNTNNMEQLLLGLAAEIGGDIL